MKQSTRIISFFLSFWMFMVSTGFSMSFHYCDGTMESWSIIGDTNACTHHQEKDICCNKQEKLNKSCCKQNNIHDNKETIKLNEGCCVSSKKMILLNKTFDFTTYNISIPALINYVNLFSTMKINANKNITAEIFFKRIKEPPPLSADDIQIAIQSFLI